MTTQLQVRKHKLLFPSPLALGGPRSGCTSSHLISSYQSLNSPPPTSLAHACTTMTEGAKPSPNRLLPLSIRNGLADSGPRRPARPPTRLCNESPSRLPNASGIAARNIAHHPPHGQQANKCDKSVRQDPRWRACMGQPGVSEPFRHPLAAHGGTRGCGFAVVLVCATTSPPPVRPVSAYFLLFFLCWILTSILYHCARAGIYPHPIAPRLYSI